MKTTTRRGFLKSLTNIAVAIQAAPALRVSELLFVAPPAELAAVYSALDLNAMLVRMYTPLVKEMLFEESFLSLLAKGDKTWQGGSITIPFTSKHGA